MFHFLPLHVNSVSDTTKVITWHFLDVVFNLSSLKLISLKLTECNCTVIFIRLFYWFCVKNHPGETETKPEEKWPLTCDGASVWLTVKFQVSARDQRDSLLFLQPWMHVSDWQKHSSASRCFWFIISSRKTNKLILLLIAIRLWF